METEYTFRLVELAKRFIEGDASAYNPLYDLLVENDDERSKELDLWLRRVLVRGIDFYTKEAFMEIFIVNILKMEGKSAISELQKMFDRAEAKLTPFLGLNSGSAVVRLAVPSGDTK
jgi:hypothetical protein